MTIFVKSTRDGLYFQNRGNHAAYIKPVDGGFEIALMDSPAHLVLGPQNSLTMQTAPGDRSEPQKPEEGH